MALRHRLRMELSKFLSPVTQAGVCCHQSRKALNLVALSVMLGPSARNPGSNWNEVRGFHERRISTMAVKLHEPATEIDLLSFIKASLDEFEGTHHYWLNRSEKIDQPFGADGIYLVLAASNFNCDITLKILKTIQKRFPHINIIGLGAIHSCSDQVHLMQLLMAENIAFPILLSQQTCPKIGKGACYMLFKNFRSPVIYHEKDASLEVLSQAVQELDEKAVGGHSNSLHVVRCTSLEQHWIIKDLCSFSPLQNLLLYYPGCVSADESHNRLFFSDCNHHRILVSDGNGKILDCIGSSPGFEDGDFESAKLRRPAGSYYHPTEDCLYFVDSENHAIRKADMGARTVDTLYPTSTSNKGGIHIWNWIMTKLGFESSGKTSVEETSEVFDSKSLYFPWHLLKSVDDTLYIIDRRFRTLWIMDISSRKIDEVLEGSPRIFEICGQSIMKRLSVIDRIPSDLFQQETKSGSILGGLPPYLLSSLATLQNHIFVCDPVGQRILKVCGESGVYSNFGLSNLGILGLPYWLNFPLETFYAVGNGLLGTAIDHVEYLDLLPGRIDIHLNVDIPVDIELIEPLQESCIWCQARGAATGMDEVPGSLYKAGVAQQWYDELDYLAAPKPESEINVQDDNLDKNSVEEDDEKVRISCVVCTSPGTSEVIIYAALYCKLKRIPNSNEGNREEHAARILDIVTSKRSGKIERDSWKAFLLQSKGDMRDLIFMLPLHVRIRLNSLDHPKADNGRDIILTDTSVKVNVLLS